MDLDTTLIIANLCPPHGEFTAAPALYSRQFVIVDVAIFQCSQTIIMDKETATTFRVHLAREQSRVAFPSGGHTWACVAEYLTVLESSEALRCDFDSKVIFVDLTLAEGRIAAINNQH